MPNWTVVEGKLSDGLPMRLYLAERDDKIWSASLHDDVHSKPMEEFEWRLATSGKWERREAGGGSDFLGAAVRQVVEYFKGSRLTFDLPLAYRGTTFQTRVWQELTRIPFGETRSYGDIAGEIDNPKASRAVGSANAKNKLPLFVPCHRVIACGGKLGGFTGGLGLKTRLLAHEQSVLRRDAA